MKEQLDSAPTRCATRNNSNATEHIYTVDSLRGLAALAVCWFHMTHGNETFLQPGVLRNSGNRGYLGVQVFFVISGFIIPWALSRANYKPRYFFIFLLKRIIRLDPPYIVAIILVVFTAFLSSFSPLYHGQPFIIDWRQVLWHLGYLNAFVGKD